MEKVARFLPLGLFCVYSIKIMTQDILDIPEGIILMVMGALSAFVQYNKSEEFKELEARINLLQSAAEKDAQEISRVKREVEDTKGLLNGVKLGQQLRNQMNRT